MIRKKYMKKSILLSIFLVLSVSGFSQSYLGWITSKVNFREQPSMDASIMCTLNPGTQIFIVSLETDGDFYNIIDIQTNTEGYVNKKFVKIGTLLEENDQGIFTPNGKSTSYDPEIEIFNNTSLILTLKLNTQIYSFSPQQKRTLTVSPGTISYRASAPGVIPNFGSESIEGNQGYTWQFYIVTSRR
jgi:hypothetical protein